MPDEGVAVTDEGQELLNQGRLTSLPQALSVKNLPSSIPVQWRGKPALQCVGVTKFIAMQPQRESPLLRPLELRIT